MTFFYILFVFVVAQRLLEVVYARFNEKRMKEQGAVEAGADHYKWIVLLHVFFFLSLLAEVLYFGTSTARGWSLFLSIFLIAQVLRVWTLSSLGKFWNTKIIVLPGATKVSRGPYRWIPHPNYIVVAMEIAALPLIFGAWRTALFFSIANALLLLLVRIPAEEKALQELKG
ncbi:hypothetical protein F9802_13915 [Bacillus aerolatus]|uniref:Isoprenylcysteine carboxyl methyltransferase n=2 Tax=Bacillus aerolatus TaxID=2653354 RepID=A0A6I1FNQ9_9BACI|nr:hypothetical protein F9802_13915 [Bacillus aerolatus]